MDYQKFFADGINALKDKGNYRVFADLERQAGEFPRALSHSTDGDVDDFLCGRAGGSLLCGTTIATDAASILSQSSTPVERRLDGSTTLDIQ